jgi:hypothetical protein
MGWNSWGPQWSEHPEASLGNADAVQHFEDRELITGHRGGIEFTGQADQIQSTYNSPSRRPEMHE